MYTNINIINILLKFTLVAKNIYKCIKNKHKWKKYHKNDIYYLLLFTNY